jgi:hypothetical protein
MERTERCFRDDVEYMGMDTTSETRQLSLVKGEERFVFRYQTGQESQVIDAFASMAGDQDSCFDWFDAAVLSYQMGRRIETDLDQIAVSSERQEE